MQTKTVPMAVHKSVWISTLRRHPEDLSKLFGDEFGTVEEAVKFLVDAKEEWIVGRDFVTDEELTARREASKQS